jgi:hypothetical protein
MNSNRKLISILTLLFEVNVTLVTITPCTITPWLYNQKLGNKCSKCKITPFNIHVTLFYVLLLYEKIECKCDINKQRTCEKGYFKVVYGLPSLFSFLSSLLFFILSSKVLRHLFVWLLLVTRRVVGFCKQISLRSCTEDLKRVYLPTYKDASCQNSI